MWQLQRWIGWKNHKICKTFKFNWNLQPNKWKKIWHRQLNTAPLTEYINNPIYQELINEDDYFGSKSDERIYLDLRTSSGCTDEAEKLERNDSKINLHILLKSAATKKLRLRVWAHSIGEYLYILARSGLTLWHGKNAINQEEKDFLEWEEDNR